MNPGFIRIHTQAPLSLSRLKISSNHPLISHSSPWRCRPLKYWIRQTVFNQEIVMQHFDLYSKYSILITISDSLKFLFREPRFHPDSHSSPPFPLKTQDLFEPSAHFALFALEVPSPEVLDTANCLNSSSSSSELITISSQDFSCS